MTEEITPSRSTGIDQKLQNRVIALRTMTIGRVIKVFANGWVEVDPQIQMVVRDQVTGVETPRDVSVLHRVPTGFYKAGGFVFTLPVAEGDEGIVVFSDRSLDLWKATGAKNPPKDTRFHDLSDGVFIPFPTSTSGAVQGFDTTGAYLGLEDKSAYVRVGNDGIVTIKAAAKTVFDTPLAQFTGAVEMASTLDVTGVASAANFVTPDGFNAETHRHPNGGLPTNPSGTYVP